MSRGVIEHFRFWAGGSRLKWPGAAPVLHTNAGRVEQGKRAADPRRVTACQGCHTLHKKDRLPVRFSATVKTGYGSAEE